MSNEGNIGYDNSSTSMVHTKHQIINKISNYNSPEKLLRPDSRWRNLVTGAEPTRKRKRSGPFDALLYVKGLGNSPDQNRKAVKEAIQNAEHTTSAYELNESGQVIETTLAANTDAYNLILEMDQLIGLARTVYPDPVRLQDWIMENLEARFRNPILRHDLGKEATLRRGLEWAVKWVSSSSYTIDFT